MAPQRIIALELADTVRVLASVPVFEGCPEDELELIAGRAHTLAYHDGEVIIPEGEEGLGFYVVLAGRARVSREGRQVAVLGPGDFFGEVALLSNSPRTATVRADGPATVLGIMRAWFKPMLTRNPRVAMRILEAEAERSAID